MPRRPFPKPCPPNGPDGWPAFPRGRKKVLVSGSRGLRDYRLLKEHIDHYTFNFDDMVIITGGCGSGADALAARYAFEERYLLIPCVAEWDVYGKAAGPRRNQEMVDFCSYAIFFWDGRSPGTLDCLTRLKKTGKPYRLVRFQT